MKELLFYTNDDTRRQDTFHTGKTIRGLILGELSTL